MEQPSQIDPIRVFIVDPHPVAVRGLLRLLSHEEDLTHAGHAPDVEAALQRLSQEACNVVIVGVSAWSTNVLKEVWNLKTKRPELPLLILSSCGHTRLGVEALHAGAEGYVTKEASLDELLDAVRKVATGTPYMSRSVKEALVQTVDGQGGLLGPKCLSPREDQVMRKLVNGMRIGEIASELGLSPKTISTYRQRVLEKLRLNDTCELVTYAMRHGLTGSPEAEADGDS